MQFHFLSRLCGGEVGLVDTGYYDVFLSRLCGGEVPSLPITLDQFFLSRLCGGEEAPHCWR